jgi:hypothetical protein
MNGVQGVARSQAEEVLTQHWFSGTRATVASYRMQRESDICDSVCEAAAAALIISACVRRECL